MFSKISSLISRNKSKIIVTGVVVGSAVLTMRYVRQKLREWQEKQSLQFIEETRQSLHFDSTENTCNQTILSLAPFVCEAVFKTLLTEEIVAELKKNPENKLVLWEELKIRAFTKVASIVYACSMLVIILNIQLNLIGGYVYKDSKSNTVTIDRDLQSRYLSLCHYLLGEGIKNICKIVQDNVKILVGGIPLNKDLSLCDIEQIFWSIQASISKDSRNPIQDMVKFVLPETNTKNKVLRSIIQETRDLIESDEVPSLLSSSVSQGFATVVDQIAEYFVTQDNNSSKIGEISPKATENGVSPFVNVNKVHISMARMIPIMNGLMSQSTLTLSKSYGALVQRLIHIERVKIMGANIYETFSH